MEAETMYPRDSQVTTRKGVTAVGRLHTSDLCKGGGLVGLLGSSQRNGPTRLVPRLLWETDCLARPALCEQEMSERNSVYPQEQEQRQLTSPLYLQLTPRSYIRPASLPEFRDVVCEWGGGMSY